MRLLLKSSIATFSAISLFTLIIGTPVQGAEIMWTAASGGLWTNGNNWSDSVVPGASDDVVFTSGSANATIDVDVVLSSLNVTGTYSGSIVFQQNVAANLTINNNFYLRSDASIVPTFSSTNGEGTGRVITVLGDATIDGTINANEKGFPVGGGPGAGNTGSHGGLAQGGTVTYGSITNPTSLGSSRSSGASVFGGGAIKLDVAGTLTLNGTITANGGNRDGRGAAGGSIWLIATTFAGTGTIRAIAPYGSLGGGGGGRISIEHATNLFTGSVSAAGYPGTGQSGTLWQPGRFPATGDITIATGYQYYFPDQTTNHWNLTLTGPNNWVEFHGGCLVISNLVMENDSILRFDRAKTAGNGFDMTNLAIVGNIVVSNSALYLSPEGIYELAGDLLVSTGSTLYVFGNTNFVNEESGGTAAQRHGIGVTITVGGNADIGGTITANTAGFRGTTGPGAGTSSSHGGRSQAGMPCYGSLTRPSALGSGRLSGTSYAYGGGAVKLDVEGNLTLNGTITANGNAADNYGASGGSVWLIADTFEGAGNIRANATGGSGSGGGGGRVAVQFCANEYTGTVEASGFGIGKTGTYYLCESVPPVLPGTDSRTINGVTFTNTFSMSHSDVQITRSIAKWQTKTPTLTWTDATMKLDRTPITTNTATYRISGLKPDTPINIFTNNGLMTITNVPAEGSIAFIITLEAPTKISVEGPRGGIIFSSH